MNYIVVDLEFNQDFESLQVSEEVARLCPFEIIQIGAVKLDSSFQALDTFNRFIRPVIYARISTHITELTGITSSQLEYAASFPAVYDAFCAFIGLMDASFCTWGKTDMKELFRNVFHHHLEQKLPPQQYINLQPYASIHLKHSEKQLMKLQTVVEALDIPLTQPFHDAFSDACYTAEILKKIYHPNMVPKRYDPYFRPPETGIRQPRRMIDFDALMRQFEKMYHRSMTPEEQGMIKLAYQMGKTNQFMKPIFYE